ncbi:MAG: hypothetical protein SGARI_008286 [Bacillariaceae sp.]
MARQESVPDGTCKVYHNKTFAAYVDQGGFVNDVAFQRTQQKAEKRLQRRNSLSVLERHNATTDSDTDDDREANGAYGTVVTHGNTKVLVWDKQDLQQRLASRPDMDRNLKYLLSRHLMKSLLKQREARHQNARLQHEDPEGWYAKAAA